MRQGALIDAVTGAESLAGKFGMGGTRIFCRSLVCLSSFGSGKILND
jgi:hypothetical protein